MSIAHFSSERGDIKIDVYEQASEFKEIGAGVGFRIRPWRVLKRIGLGGVLEEAFNLARDDNLREP